jgi:hypothetical protein
MDKIETNRWKSKATILQPAHELCFQLANLEAQFLSVTKGVLVVVVQPV